MTTTPDTCPSHNPTSTASSAWPLEEPLHLPDFIRTYPGTNHHYASIILKSCAINHTGVKEILLVNREQCRNPLMILEIPLPIWQEQDMLEDMARCLPWQPDLGPFPYQNLLKQGNLIYNEHALICPGQAILNQESPIFRPFTSERASHILVKCTWHIPAPSLQTAYEYEHAAGHFDDSYVDAMMEKHGALLYRRAASNFYNYGADYWIFPLPEA